MADNPNRYRTSIYWTWDFMDYCRCKMTLPKLLQEKRDELAKTMGNRHANPVIRSMYPSKSRGQMAGEFSQLYSLGFSDACDLLLPEIQKLREALLRLTVRLEESASIHDIKPSAEIVKQALKSWQEFLNEK